LEYARASARNWPPSSSTPPATPRTSESISHARTNDPDPTHDSLQRDRTPVEVLMAAGGHQLPGHGRAEGRGLSYIGAWWPSTR
jgi:hypothetical protein